MNSSINKNNILSLPDQSLDYEIYSEGQLVYGGRAYKSPSQQTLDIDISKKVKDYLDAKISSAWTTTDGVYPVSGAVKTFTVFAPDTAHTYDYTFLNDWTGDWIGGEDILSEPINGKVDARMKIFWGRVSDSASSVEKKVALSNYEIEVTGNFTLPYSAGSQVFSVVSSNDNGYFATSEDEWITPTAQGSALTITVTENMGASGRTGSFCVNWYDENFALQSKCYEINQECLEGVLILSRDTVSFDYESGATNITVSANTDWSATTTSGWITITPTASTSGETTLNIQVSKNSGDERNGTIVFAYRGITRTLSVTQDDKYFKMIAQKNSAFVIQNYNQSPGYNRTYYIKIDNGNWVEKKSNQAINWIWVDKNHTVRIKGGSNVTTWWQNRLVATGSFTLKGNIDSLLGGAPSSRAFSYFFSGNTAITQAQELRLPATLGGAMFDAAFDQCTNLVTGPYMPASSLTMNAYSYMFRGCSKLNYVYCLAEENIINEENGTVHYMLKDVASTGTFIKKAGVTWPEGIIPNGWTVQEE